MKSTSLPAIALLILCTNTCHVEGQAGDWVNESENELEEAISDDKANTGAVVRTEKAESAAFYPAENDGDTEEHIKCTKVRGGKKKKTKEEKQKKKTKKPKRAKGRRCYDSRGCEEGYACEKKWCWEVLELVSEESDDYCRHDRDCGDGFQCSKRKCTEETPKSRDDDDEGDIDDDENDDEDDEDCDTHGGGEEEIPDIQFGRYAYFGSGCPDNSMELVASPDGRTLSLLFSDFTAYSDEDQAEDHKSCSLMMPVDVTPGYSVGISKVDYRGYAYVPNERGSRARFEAEYNFAGKRGPRISRSFRDYSDDLFLTNSVRDVAWSPCGERANTFRVSTRIMTKMKSESGNEVVIAVDTSDLRVLDDGETGFTYHMAFRKCKRD